MRCGWCAISPGRVGAWKPRRVRRLAAAPLDDDQNAPVIRLHIDGEYAILGLDAPAHARVMLAAGQGSLLRRAAGAHRVQAGENLPKRVGSVFRQALPVPA